MIVQYNRLIIIVTEVLVTRECLLERKSILDKHGFLFISLKQQFFFSGPHAVSTLMFGCLAIRENTNFLSELRYHVPEAVLLQHHPREFRPRI